MSARFVSVGHKEVRLAAGICGDAMTLVVAGWSDTTDQDGGGPTPQKEQAAGEV
jgi:hypothetical protein